MATQNVRSDVTGMVGKIVAQVGSELAAEAT